jgi:hypothetical protein
LAGAGNGETPRARHARLHAVARALCRHTTARAEATPGGAGPTRARCRGRPLPVRGTRLHAASRTLRRAGRAHASASACDARLVVAGRRIPPGSLGVARLHTVARALGRARRTHPGATAGDTRLRAAVHRSAPLTGGVAQLHSVVRALHRPGCAHGAPSLACIEAAVVAGSVVARLGDVYCSVAQRPQGCVSRTVVGAAVARAALRWGAAAGREHEANERRDGGDAYSESLIHSRPHTAHSNRKDPPLYDSYLERQRSPRVTLQSLDWPVCGRNPPRSPVLIHWFQCRREPRWRAVPLRDVLLRSQAYGFIGDSKFARVRYGGV